MPADHQAPHVSTEPGILYFGTPVVLVSTVNEDGSYNVAPFSSAFWLAWRCVLGMGSQSKTPQNIVRTRECVINLPAASQVGAVNQLSRLTGTSVVPPSKAAMGYSYEKDKFGAAGLTPISSETVAAPRVLECPVQLEAVLVARHEMMQDDAAMQGFVWTLEMRINRVHVHPDLLMDGKANRIDPDKWRPLIMSFQKYYGLTTDQLDASRLSEIPESAYVTPDIARARAAASLHSTQTMAASATLAQAA